MHEHIEIPEATRSAWQSVVDILADVVGVPAALVTRVRDEAQLEVFVASRTPGNVFTQGEIARRGAGVYCEHTMAGGEVTSIPNAAADPTFSGVDAENRGMLAYLGVPLSWPDGSAFGALCVMDSREHHFSARHEILVAQFREIVDQHLALLFQQHELRERTRRDALTGACTRREFYETGRAELKRARRYGHPLCLLILDLDHFRRINDEHGHVAGDRALKVLSRRVMDSLRSSDRLYRLAGEEFVILLPHSELGEALLVAERIRVLVETRPVESGDVVMPVTVSIGISRLEGAGETLDELVDKADRALKAAKVGGRNRVEVHERLKRAEA